MSNSPLVTYKRISNKKNSPRNHKIDTITIHCVVGQWTAKYGCDYFATTTREASCNYIVGYDGSIGLCVDEGDRSWCTSSYSNDHRAITIEVASDTYHPYAVTEKAYDALIKLCADICIRNGIKELKWKADKSLIGQVDKQNMTVHRWFANKACPGEYLYSRHGDIASKVNAIISGSNPTSKPEKPTVKKSVEEIANEVIEGKWGNGEDRKNRLTSAGYNYSEVQAKVNELVNAKKNPVKKSVDELAKEVLEGKWGNGSDRKNRLTNAGYNYAEVQAKVNELVNAKKNPVKKSVEEVAREVIQGKWGNGSDRKKRLTDAGYNYSEVQSLVNKLLKK